MARSENPEGRAAYVTISMPAPLLDEAKQKAAEEFITISRWISSIVRMYLAKQKRTK
jgi:predicted DNA binding CopG/RHH family protein